ncbi:MAG: 4-hydroxybenzoate octaprenyltransferase [Phycisphaeraceae bacterium]|nr:MAG: 4-hydroxybenzoate octaprenyltransferase [Phycisphaeraceae bacterium]
MTTPSVSIPRTHPLALALSDIKLAHTVFALPFAVLGAFLATPAARGEESWGVFAGQLGLVVVCMFFARTWAMLVNRLADRRFDAANPRTAGRAMASGRLDARAGLAVALGAAAAFLATCGLFLVFFGNTWPLLLSVPTLAWIGFYSFTKRFTALCHLFLGGALAASPLAAAIAVHPEALGATPALWLIAGMVLLWVAGFDVAYALQDLNFDRETGLRSVPAKLGAGGALWAARLLHLGAFAMLALAWGAEPRFGWLFGTAAAGVGGLLVYEHVVLAKRGVAGLPLAFFTLNGVVSCVLGVAGSVDVVW